MPNPNTSGTGYTMLATILQIYGEEEGWKLLRDLHLNVAQYTRAGTNRALGRAGGEVAIGVTFHARRRSTRPSKASPFSVRAPADGTGFEIGGLSLVRNGPNREGGHPLHRVGPVARSPGAGRPAGRVVPAAHQRADAAAGHTPAAVLDEVSVIPYDFELLG